MPPGEQPCFELAPITDLDGVPRIFYIGWYIRDAQRHADVPRLTERQLEAMELLESIANDPAFHVEMDFQPGDVQLLNNAGSCTHARPTRTTTTRPSAATCCGCGSPPTASPVSNKDCAKASDRPR